jgi:hypothetical protein
MIWDRKDGESDVAFEAFTIYRDMGPARSIAQVSRQLDKDVTLLERWSRRHGWVVRANTWDAHLDREKQKETVRERKEMAKRHARIAMAAQQKLVERLQSMDFSSINASDIPRWLEATVKMERLSRGVSEDSLDINGVPDDLNLRTLNDEDLEKLDNLLRKAGDEGLTKDQDVEAEEPA